MADLDEAWLSSVHREWLSANTALLREQTNKSAGSSDPDLAGKTWDDRWWTLAYRGFQSHLANLAKTGNGRKRGNGGSGA